MFVISTLRIYGRCVATNAQASSVVSFTLVLALKLIIYRAIFYSLFFSSHSC